MTESKNVKSFRSREIKAILSLTNLKTNKNIKNMISSAQDRYSFLAAIAMNNIGVSFIEQTSYDAAMDTLQKSFKIFQSLGNGESIKNENLCAHGLLAEAQTRFAKPANRCFVNPIPSTDNFKVLSTSDSILLETAGSSPNRSLLVALRIEQDTDLDEDSDIGLRAQWESIVVLYNISTLCRLFADSMILTAIENRSTNGKKVNIASKKMRQKGYTLCKQVQSNIIQVLNDIDVSESAIQHSSVLLLTLKNMIYISSDIGHVNDSRAYYCHFSDLSLSCIEDELDVSYSSSSPTQIFNSCTTAAKAA
jgi:hypothetical protein